MDNIETRSQKLVTRLWDSYFSSLDDFFPEWGSNLDLEEAEDNRRDVSWGAMVTFAQQARDAGDTSKEDDDLFPVLGGTIEGVMAEIADVRERSDPSSAIPVHVADEWARRLVLAIRPS